MFSACIFSFFGNNHWIDIKQIHTNSDYIVHEELKLWSIIFKYQYLGFDTMLFISTLAEFEWKSHTSDLICIVICYKNLINCLSQFHVQSNVNNYLAFALLIE